MTQDELRMSAYYYEFSGTGCRDIDLILSAVACAGKAFHGTECWNETASAYANTLGSTPIEWIQNAANAAVLKRDEENAESQQVMGLMLAHKDAEIAALKQAHADLFATSQQMNSDLVALRKELAEAKYVVWNDALESVAKQFSNSPNLMDGREYAFEIRANKRFKPDFDAAMQSGK